MTQRQMMLASMAATILSGRQQGAAQAVKDASMILDEIDAKDAEDYHNASHGGEFGVTFCEHAVGEEGFLFADMAR